MRIASQLFRIALPPLILFGLSTTAAAQTAMGPAPPVTCVWSSESPANKQRNEEHAKPTTKIAEEPLPWKIPPRPSDETAATRPLSLLNSCSRDLYARAHKDAGNEAAVLILVRDAGATLFLDGKPVETKRILPAMYFNLRYASHVPLAVLATLLRLPDGVASAESAARLRAYAAMIRAASPTINDLPLSDEQKQRQHRILDASLVVLDRVAEDGHIGRSAMYSYAREVSIDIDANVRDAGRSQVDGLHEALLGWRAKLTDKQWCQLRFVMRVRQQARSDYGGVQYLAVVMSDPGDGRGYLGESENVIVRELSAEGKQPWDPEFDLLATIDVDAEVSQAIFGDRDRLTVDVAAHGARERVRELDLRPLSRAVCYP